MRSVTWNRFPIKRNWKPVLQEAEVQAHHQKFDLSQIWAKSRKIRAQRCFDTSVLIVRWKINTWRHCYGATIFVCFVWAPKEVFMIFEKKFFRQLWGNSTKILSTSKNLPAPAAVLERVVLFCLLVTCIIMSFKKCLISSKCSTAF